MTYAETRGRIVPALPLAAVCLTVGLVGFGGVAQAETGVALTFDLGIRVQNDSNPDLTPVSSGASTTGGVNLSFGLTSETAAATLSLEGRAGLLTADGTGSVSAGVIDPGLTLSYARAAANADFTLTAGLNTRDVGANADVADFDTGSGTRSATNLSAALTLAKQAPLGFGLNVGLTDIRYHDTTDPTLIDSQTLQLGADIRADLSPVLHASFGLSANRFAQGGQAARNSQGLNAGLTLDRPNGGLSLRFRGNDTPDGQRSSLTFAQDITLAQGSLSYSLGATRAVNGKFYANGTATYAMDLAQGGVSLDLSRAIQPGAETDTETQLSSARFSYSRPITSRANLSLSLNWAEQRDTATDLATANTSLSATWTQNLTEAWALDLGYTRRLRDEDGVGLGQSDTIFLSLHRSFDITH